MIVNNLGDRMADTPPLTNREGTPSNNNQLQKNEHSQV